MIKKHLKNFYEGLLLAVGFLTVLPLPHSIDWTPAAMRRALLSFPLCGIFTAAVVSAIGTGLISAGLPLYAVGFIVLAGFIILSGGLHLDGWMDVSDAILSWKPREEKLTVLKDPLVGSGAVWTTILLLAGKFTAIVVTLDISIPMFYAALFAVPVLSRAGMSVIVSRGVLLSATGLAASFQKKRESSDMYQLAGITLVALLPAFYFSTVLTVSLTIVTIICTAGLYRLFVHKLGGINGDTAGASLEGTEVLLWWIAAVMAVIL